MPLKVGELEGSSEEPALTAAGEDAEGESPVARAQLWSVPRGQHLLALNLRDQEEKQDGSGVAAASARVLT